MKVSIFTKLVSRGEGKHKGVPFAQVKEILRVTNDLLYGQLYAAIRRYSVSAES